MLLRSVLLFALGLVIAAHVGCAGDEQPRDDAEIVAALRDTLGRLGTRDGAGFRAGFTARGFEDYTRKWWGETADFAAGGPDLDAAVAERGYSYEAVTGVAGGPTRAIVTVRQEGRSDFSEDRFVLVQTGGRWLIDASDPHSVSPAVPADYAKVPAEVREYGIEAKEALPALPRETAFLIRNDGHLEHDIALLWLDASVPTEGFLFGVAEAWLPMLEWYGRIRVPPGDTGRLIPRQPLEHRDGRYVLYCTLGERGPSHARLGMLLELPAQ